MDFLLIENNSLYFKIYRNITETNTEFREKCRYIISKNPKNRDEFNRFSTLADIHNNIIFYKTKYPKNILDKL